MILCSRAAIGNPNLAVQNGGDEQYSLPAYLQGHYLIAVCRNPGHRDFSLHFGQIHGIHGTTAIPPQHPK
jgi:hypothetical protein